MAVNLSQYQNSPGAARTWRAEGREEMTAQVTGMRYATTVAVAVTFATRHLDYLTAPPNAGPGFDCGWCLNF